MRDKDEPPESVLASVLFFVGLSLNTGLLGSFAALLLLLLCSALISGSEIAYFSLSPDDLKKLNERGEGSSSRINFLRSRPRSLLATILITNNFINIAIVVLSESIIWNVFSEELFTSWAHAILNMLGGETLSVGLIARAINFVITVVCITGMLVLFGETAPKIYARTHNIRFAEIMSRPLVILDKIFWPLSRILVGFSTGLEKRLHRTNSRNTSKEDLDKAIELTVSSEEDSKEEADILKGIVKFSEVSVTQIMRNRVDVTSIDFNTPYHEVLELARSCGYSRIPVTREDFDNVTGILYVKDLLTHLDEPNEFEWQDLIRTDIFYAPESKKINELMKEFQERHQHMAIVVDEYGGSSGIVTLEDVMEEIIGEIRDESDEEVEEDFIKLDDKNYIFDGRSLVNDVCRHIDIDISDLDEARGDADTIAGLILEQSGILPKEDQEFEVNDQMKLKVLQVNKRRIEQVQVTIL